MPLTRRIWRSPMPRANVLICSDETGAMPSILQILGIIPRQLKPRFKTPSSAAALTPTGESNKKRRDDAPARSGEQEAAACRTAAMACRFRADRRDDADADRLCLRARSAHGRSLLLDLVEGKRAVLSRSSADDRLVHPLR